MRSLLLLGVAVLLLAAPPALAGNADYEPGAFADHTGFNTQRKMARADDGTLYYAYVRDAPSGNGTEVVVVREKDGLREELPRPGAARDDASRPSLVLDEEGVLHLAWTERAEDDREVFHAAFRDGAWRDARQLSTGRGYAGFPSLAVDGRGRLHVAWYGFDGAHYQTFYREWADGAWSPATQLSSGTIDSNNPSVVADPEGGVHVAWYKDDGQRYQIWYAHRRPDGAWELPERLTPGTAEAFNAALAVDRLGVVHAAWDELRAGGYAVLHAARGADGAWGPAREVSGADGGEYPAVAAWGPDGVLVAWATPDGRLVGTTLDGPPRPLLGGAEGRHPSLRGAMPFPASDAGGPLDVLYGTRAGDGWRVVHVALHGGCSPFEPPAACPDPAPPAARAVPAAPVASVLAGVLLALLARRHA